jgi:hypothetical protein
VEGGGADPSEAGVGVHLAGRAGASPVPAQASRDRPTARGVWEPWPGLATPQAYTQEMRVKVMSASHPNSWDLRGAGRQEAAGGWVDGGGGASCWPASRPAETCAEQAQARPTHPPAAGVPHAGRRRRGAGCPRWGEHGGHRAATHLVRPGPRVPSVKQPGPFSPMPMLAPGTRPAASRLPKMPPAICARAGSGDEGGRTRRGEGGCSSRVSMRRGGGQEQQETGGRSGSVKGVSDGAAASMVGGGVMSGGWRCDEWWLAV